MFGKKCLHFSASRKLICNIETCSGGGEAAESLAQDNDVVQVINVTWCESKHEAEAELVKQEANFDFDFDNQNVINQIQAGKMAANEWQESPEKVTAEESEKSDYEALERYKDSIIFFVEPRILDSKQEMEFEKDHKRKLDQWTKAEFHEKSQEALKTVPPKHKEVILDLLFENRDIFVKDLDDLKLGCKTFQIGSYQPKQFSAHIQTSAGSPIHRKLYGRLQG